MIKSSAATILSLGRRVLSSTSPIARTLGRRRPLVQTTVVALLFAIVIYAYFSPIFEGYTFSDIANRQKGVYPWVHLARDRSAPLHYDQADTFYPWQVFVSRTLRDGEVP